MKFVALVSGGKDSCFNIIHCLNAGHELVAMANLHPKQNRPDEIDSWMFQTVGYKAIEYLARCAEVPLYRSEISEDEELVVKELQDLFNHIRSSGIEFEGVSVGAIGSTYQQIRVDKACEYSGCRSLAYLWQRDQAELLHEIVTSGLDARIVKVAGMGLNERHLGKSLREVEDDLLEKHASFGLHPCGEGGEYETMVFDAPFFKSQRLVLVDGSEKVVHHSTDDVFYLEFSTTLQDKPNTDALASTKPSSLPIPPLLVPLGSTKEINAVSNLDTSRELGPKHSQYTTHGTFISVFAELMRLFTSKLNIESCYHVLVVIKDMSRFAEMNEQYNKVFQMAAKSLGSVPPSRACVQAAISAELEVTVFYSEEVDRSGKGIHVQGLSYWAPASIGPYAQCRLVYGISYVAGQIGLIPQSLVVADNDFDTEATLALQNATRILDVIHETRSNWGIISAILYITDPASISIAQQIWNNFSKLPLVAVVVEELPRKANFEWSLQACDLRYFSWFIPDNDEDEEFYSNKPELVSRNKGHTVRCGFSTRQVSCDSKIEGAQYIFTSIKSPDEYLNSRMGNWHWTPAKEVYYNGSLVNEVYIKNT